MTTRDEVIRQAEKALGRMPDPGAQSIEARKFVDMAVALGILKLDEPKSGLDILTSRLAGDFGYSHSGQAIKDLKLALAASGLVVVRKNDDFKIVEK